MIGEWRLRPSFGVAALVLAPEISAQVISSRTVIPDSTASLKKAAATWVGSARPADIVRSATWAYMTVKAQKGRSKIFLTVPHLRPGQGFSWGIVEGGCFEPGEVVVSKRARSGGATATGRALDPLKEYSFAVSTNAHRIEDAPRAPGAAGWLCGELVNEAVRANGRQPTWPSDLAPALRRTAREN